MYPISYWKYCKLSYRHYTQHSLLSVLIHHHPQLTPTHPDFYLHSLFPFLFQYTMKLSLFIIIRYFKTAKTKFFFSPPCFNLHKQEIQILSLILILVLINLSPIKRTICISHFLSQTERGLYCIGFHSGCLSLCLSVCKSCHAIFFGVFFYHFWTFAD